MTAPLPANVEDVYRLSPIQQGMLFHTLSAGKAAPYLDQFVFYYGRVDLDALERAWRRLVQRHPVLRTSFFWEEVEEPVQLVHRAVDLPVTRLDWLGEPLDERERRLAVLLEEDRARGFALDRAPLMRLTFIRWEEGVYRAVWSYNHMLLDGWSVGLTLQEVGALYAAERRQSDPDLPTRRPFRDYIGWLRQQDLKAAEAYWRDTLDGFAEPTALAFDRAPGLPVSAEDHHAEAERTLPETLTLALQSFARQNRITLHTVVEAAWALALARFSGRRDVVFGNTVSGRPPSLPGAEAMIGCFINTLPVRVQAPPEAEVIPWMRDLQRHQMELRRFEHSPLVEIRKWARLAGRFPAHRPLFEAILVFENYLSQAGPAAVQGNAEEKPGRGFDGLQRTHFPLTLVVWPGRELKLRAGYYAGRFAPEDVDRLLDHVETLLAAFLALRPGARLADLPALAAAEAARAAPWQAPREIYPSRCLHELFAEQAARRPDAVAVTSGSAGTGEAESLTYRELDERANQLARHLRRMGVGPEVPVGLCADRSPALVTALLAILKAGGAYVPLDPAYPAERLAYLVEDSGVGIVVTEDRFAASFAGPRLVRLDGDRESVEMESREAPEPGAVPESLAYVIYTSGSTGRPKGSLIPHANVARLLAATREPLGLGEEDVWALFHSYAFDFSVWEIWGALAFGGRLVVVPYAVSRSPEAFHQLLRRERVTVLNQTPSAFAQLAQVDADAGEPLPGLRLVLFGGEALDPATLAPWYARHGDRRPLLANLYGITETTVHVTLRPLSGADTAGGGSPIGPPLAHLSTPLLDRWGEPVPAGAPGEIHVGGAGLARGYRGRPDLTAERFVPDPFSGEPGARLYRSGDLARLAQGGLEHGLEYLGRIDHQVKIRGFRIEPGEVEAELRRHPAVQQACVLADGEGAERRLVAFVVVPDSGPESAAEGAPDAAELREHLRGRLPDYMVPAAWAFLPALPLTPHGKVDAAALRRNLHGGTTALAVAPYEAPRGGLEQTVAAVWQEVLGVERVGVHDNFFDLGGHSILMIQVQRRLQEQLGRKLSMVDLLSHASVSALARFLAGPGDAVEDTAEPEAELAAAVQAERAEEGKSRLLQMRRAGRSAGSGSGDESP